MMPKPKKNILICPLDWGLGHATRMVPVIKEVKGQGANVILAADNGPLDFLLRYFPNEKIIKLRGFSPSYPLKGSMSWKIVRSIPQIIHKSRLARRSIKRIISEYKIDAIISDNRYELSGMGVPTVFVTHQLNIQTSGLQKLMKPLINVIINNMIDAFDEVWVPDSSDHRLSGNLSKTNKFITKLHFIGILSRFSSANVKSKTVLPILVLLSGPEPQRTILENKLIEQSLESGFETVILQGLPGKISRKQIKNITLISHADDDELAEYILSAKHIICRPGYSTLMDLAAINKSGIFIPTPGQTEQEYLSKRFLKDKIAFSVSQDKFNLTNAINKGDNYKGFHISHSNLKLKERINFMLNNC
ncbi:MAG: hypothetical protein CMF58_00450 [Lentimicrobiaceae bacterium]|jgi:hypothetical protein|nr:hypothetical protein [Lentimicrobiaceae bacterium]|tara:strand:- start:457 stop:1539 length:1083 start_codon:yes stop_codon:yes gene_type:complete